MDEAIYAARAKAYAAMLADDLSKHLPDGLRFEFTPVVRDTALISAARLHLGGMSQWGAIALAANEMCNPE